MTAWYSYRLVGFNLTRESIQPLAPLASSLEKNMTGSIARLVGISITLHGTQNAVTEAVTALSWPGSARHRVQSIR